MVSNCCGGHPEVRSGFVPLLMNSRQRQQEGSVNKVLFRASYADDKIRRYNAGDILSEEVSITNKTYQWREGIEVTQ